MIHCNLSDKIDALLNRHIGTSAPISSLETQVL